MNISLERRRELLSSMLSAAQNPLRLSPLLQAPSTQVLEAVRKLGLEGVIGKRIGSIYEPANDQARGSSTAPTENRNSSLAVTPRGRMGSMPSLEFTKTKNSSSWPR